MLPTNASSNLAYADPIEDRQTLPVRQIVRHSSRLCEGARVRQDVSAEIAELRQLSGFTQWQVAAILGVHQATVANWERGHRRPPRAYLPVLRLLVLAYAHRPQAAILGLHPDGSVPTLKVRKLLAKCGLGVK